MWRPSTVQLMLEFMLPEHRKYRTILQGIFFNSQTKKKDYKKMVGDLWCIWTGHLTELLCYVHPWKWLRAEQVKSQLSKMLEYGILLQIMWLSYFLYGKEHSQKLYQRIPCPKFFQDDQFGTWKLYKKILQSQTPILEIRIQDR